MRRGRRRRRRGRRGQQRERRRRGWRRRRWGTRADSDGAARGLAHVRDVVGPREPTGGRVRVEGELRAQDAVDLRQAEGAEEGELLAGGRAQLRRDQLGGAVDALWAVLGDARSAGEDAVEPELRPGAPGGVGGGWGGRGGGRWGGRKGRSGRGRGRGRVEEARRGQPQVATGVSSQAAHRSSHDGEGGGAGGGVGKWTTPKRLALVSSQTACTVLALMLCGHSYCGRPAARRADESEEQPAG